MTFKKNALIMMSVLVSTFSTPLLAESVSLGGSSNTLNLETINTITRTEYSYVEYESTCYEQVVVGSREECRTTSHPRYETKCEKVPGVGPVCHQEQTGTSTEESCREVPVTESHPYSCTRTRKVAEQVPDYDIKTVITVVKNNNARDFDLKNCSLTVSVTATAESFTAACKEAIIKARVSDRRETIKNGDKLRTMKVDLDFSSIEPLKALSEGLYSLSYDNQKLSFKTSRLDLVENFTLGLNVTRNRLLLKDKVIFNKNLKSSDYTVEAISETEAKITVNLNQIGASFEDNKKHVLRVSLQAAKKIDLESVINSPALKNELSESLTVNK